jgi:tRNA dimethylallyltransferase
MDPDKKNFLLVLSGPTAVGKTDLSITLARHFNTEIISADSRQFFKELNIGVAKPSQEQLHAVPHHFVDFISIEDNYDAATFEKEALQVLQELFESKKIVIVTGGSGLYLDALCKGFDEIPKTEPGIREELNKVFTEKGLTYIQELLKENDPDYYDRVDLNNSQRIIRALEVSISSGRPYSSYRKSSLKERNFNVIHIGIYRQREELYKRINDRVDQMIQSGLEAEARALLPYSKLNALQTVGYRELFDYFNGLVSLETAKEAIKQNTRRYAKRQMTWFRKNPEIVWFLPEELEKIIRFVEEKLND